MYVSISAERSAIQGAPRRRPLAHRLRVNPIPNPLWDRGGRRCCCSQHLRSLPYRNTIARQLCDTRLPTDPLLYAIHHTNRNGGQHGVDLEPC